VGRIIWIMVSIFFIMPLCSTLAAGDPNDAAGSKDPDLFTRMPGFHIYNYEVREFDRFEFPVGPNKTEKIEGRYIYVDYYANNGITLPSGLQIVKNYENAIKAIGGSVVYEWDDAGEYATLKAIKDTTEVWAQIAAASNGMYKINIIEKKAMKQDVVANADVLAGSIKATGKVAVYGIYFDTDKADIKPGSEAALAEIVKMLKADSKLKLYVVGHTDNVGQFGHNVKLSQERAAAVAKELVGKYGIAASRLIAYGDGPTSPVAPNNTENGRSKNRRVELVDQ
jgi:OOP family OmpA-OmpF porin